MKKKIHAAIPEAGNQQFHIPAPLLLDAYSTAR
jgi:hypothetical protein